MTERNFLELVDEYVRYPFDYALRVVTVAQWANESGWGTSKLSKDHNNYAGLKWRPERMEGVDARGFQYQAHDGWDTYTEFADYYNFIKGYWQWIGLGPTYEDPRKYAGDPRGYLAMLQRGGYAESSTYVEDIMKLYDDAEKLVLESAQRQGIDLDEGGTVPPSSTGGKMIRLAVIVGHNSSKPGACAIYGGIPCEYPFNTQIAELMSQFAGDYQIEMEIFFRKSGMSYSSEIDECYARVNSWNPDFVTELHYNGASPDANGTEVLYYIGSSDGRVLATAVLEELLSLHGLRNRGLKERSKSDRGGRSLWAAAAPAIMPEPFFGSNRGDCEKVASVGYEAFAKAYLYGVQRAGHNLGITTPPTTEPPVEPEEPPIEEDPNSPQAIARNMFKKYDPDEVQVVAPTEDGDAILVYKEPPGSDI